MYQLIRSHRKTYALIVQPDGQLIVRVPLRATRAQVEELVRSKEAWIRRKQEEARRSHPKPPPRRYVDGEQFLYLGQPYALQIASGQSSPLKLGDCFTLASEARPQADQVFEAWYRRQARRVIAERVRMYAARYGLAYSRLSITGARTRWGSCGVKGSLNFTWRLILAPLWVIDYVVVHELAHLQVRSHSKAFWGRVAAMLPDYRQPQAWLKENGHRLSLEGGPG
jgi:predicted metal-dependent hydrolase